MQLFLAQRRPSWESSKTNNWDAALSDPEKGQTGWQAAESRLALWLCLAGEVGLALEQKSTVAFVYCSVKAVTICLCLLCGLGQLCPGTIFPPTPSSRR